jgi:hypothetical protein
VTIGYGKKDIHMWDKQSIFVTFFWKFQHRRQAKKMWQSSFKIVVKDITIYGSNLLVKLNNFFRIVWNLDTEPCSTRVPCCNGDPWPQAVVIGIHLGSFYSLECPPNRNKSSHENHLVWNRPSPPRNMMSQILDELSCYRHSAWHHFTNV